MFESFEPELPHAAVEAYHTPEVYDELDQACRTEVVEWRWATDDMSFGFRFPFAKEWFRRNPRWLKPGATPKPGNLRHGLDAEDRVRVIEDFTCEDKLGKKPTMVGYVVYHEDETELILYRCRESGPPDVEHYRRRAYEGERLTREHNLLGWHGSERHYEWEGDRLTRVVSVGWSQLFLPDSRKWDPLEIEARTEERFEYDSLGRLERIVERRLKADGTVREGLPPRIIYERPKKGESIPQLAREIERMLLEQVPETVAQAKGKGPFYCLLLCYCGEDFPAGWPPFLLLGSEAERQRIVEGGDEIGCLWIAGEMEGREANVRLPLDDEILNNYCRLHNQLMVTSDSFTSAMTVLRRVGKALDKLDWSGIIEVTPDFLVAPVDDHCLTEPAEDIKAVIPAAAFRSLRKRGLI